MDAYLSPGKSDIRPQLEWHIYLAGELFPQVTLNSEAFSLGIWLD